MDQEPDSHLTMSSSELNRKSKQLQRKKLRGDARQQATLAQKLSEFNLEEIVTTTSEGATLIASLQEATRIALAAETTHTMKAKECENTKKEYGDPGEVDMSDLVAIARASLVRMAVNEVSQAEENVTAARAQLEKIRCDLTELVKGGTEVNDSLTTLLEEMKLEE